MAGIPGMVLVSVKAVNIAENTEDTCSSTSLRSWFQLQRLEGLSEMSQVNLRNERAPGSVCIHTCAQET